MIFLGPRLLLIFRPRRSRGWKIKQQPRFQGNHIGLTVVTSERAQRAERVLSYLREKSEYSRPDPTRPDPITLFKVLYLRNRMTDRQAVFFDEYHLDVKVVWHGYRIASVPVMARGACQTWGTLDDPQNILPQ